MMKPKQIKLKVCSNLQFETLKIRTIFLEKTLNNNLFNFVYVYITVKYKVGGELL